MTPKQPPPDERSEPRPPPPGFHYVWVELEHRRLATTDEQSRRCRRAGPGFACRRAPVMALRRSNGWWLYCDWHMYGSEIRDGKIMSRRLVPDETSVPA